MNTNKEKLSPYQKRKKERDNRVLHLVSIYEKKVGKTTAYMIVATKMGLSYPTVLRILKKHKEE